VSDGTRYPYESAIKVAVILQECLRPACQRIEIAGSLRRMKDDVGDIELLYVPKIVERPGLDMFEPDIINLADEAINSLLADGLLRKRLNKNGGTAWGSMNKLAVCGLTGIPVDLFLTTDASWYNYLVCRTGPADSNTEIATRAKKASWRWNPYGEGFTSLDSGRVIPTRSEREVFEFVGMAYKEPKDR
jgi:DNA polymerase/3'-5' exonuclease PolX